MADRIQLRRDTAANWTAYNPILLEGEPGIELDTDQWKLGDGIHTWLQLAYRGGECLQQMGNSTTTPMSQKATTEAVKSIVNTINQPVSDLDFSDENGNVLVRFQNGNVKTKNFDSSENATEIKRGLMSATDKTKLNTIEQGAEVNDVETIDDDSADLNFSDENGNILIQSKNGHIRTKNFDSSNYDASFNEYCLYNRGGAPITNIPSTSDLKIFSTLQHIISDCPYADIILVSNFYAAQATAKDAKRRAYKKELQAITTFLSLGLIELDSLGIIRKGVASPGIFTVDGKHAYTVAGATKIYNYIHGFLNTRYNNFLDDKKILILGDSSCVENPSGSDTTTWAKILKSVLTPGNVDIRAVSGSSWLYNSSGQIDTNNVENQFDKSNKDADIIIITAGGNELLRFNLDYEGTIKYLMSNY